MSPAPILVGASSWSERSLVHDSHWYPRRSMKAAERMAFYASRLPLVEIDASARFPPTPDLCRQWTDRTPEGFTIDVQAWSLLTGDSALPDSLWEDLRDEVREELRDRRRLYAGHLSRAGWAECWDRFAHALRPLVDSGRLGVVILRYPGWLRPGDTGRSLLAEARRRWPDLPLAVELRHPGWLEPAVREDTLGFLEHHDLAFVCVDRIGADPVVASTADVAVVRLPGRNPGDWSDPDEDIPWGQRYAYRYTDDELEEWAGRIRYLAGAGHAVHVLLSNTWQDHAVVNAERLARLCATSPEQEEGRAR